MAHRISVAEELNDFGQQVFTFGLPNGRTLKLEFCQPMADPEGDACCAVVTLLDEQGQRADLAVNDLGGTPRQTMQVANLWFSTSLGDWLNGRILKQELNAIKEQLAPLMEATEEGHPGSVKPNTPELVQCGWCDSKSEEDQICAVCTGCPVCCDSDYHCAYCERPFGVCVCPNRRSPLNDTYWKEAEG